MAAVDAEAWRSIGTRLRQLRKRRGWSCQALGEAASVDPKTVQAIETGLRKASVQMLCRLMKALGVRWNAVFQDPEPEPRPNP
jgi:transcriptional regulator with XRE-family HTH domain